MCSGIPAIRPRLSGGELIIYRKPLAGPVVQKKATAGDEEKKTPFAIE